jgi:hypothetical protein
MTSSIILLEAKNEFQLLKAYAHINDTLGIECERFYEPDSNLGYEPSYTAFATVPITAEQRHHFKKYRLFKLKTPYQEAA